MISPKWIPAILNDKSVFDRFMIDKWLQNDSNKESVLSAIYAPRSREIMAFFLLNYSFDMKTATFRCPVPRFNQISYGAPAYLSYKSEITNRSILGKEVYWNYGVASHLSSYVRGFITSFIYNSEQDQINTYLESQGLK